MKALHLASRSSRSSPTMLPRAPQTTRQCNWDVRTASRPIAESTAPSMNIGGLLTATDFHLGDSLTYSLTVADAGCFDIVSASGQLRTTSGAVYDYETRSSYNVIVYNVIVTIDDEADTATIVVSITVTAISKNSNAIATCRPPTGRPSKAPRSPMNRTTSSTSTTCLMRSMAVWRHSV